MLEFSYEKIPAFLQIYEIPIEPLAQASRKLAISYIERSSSDVDKHVRLGCAPEVQWTCEDTQRERRVASLMKDDAKEEETD